MSPPQQLRQQTFNCSLLLIYRPRKDERLSWPGWLTYSGWFTHISGHPSATRRAQDSESTPAKDRHYTAGPRNQARDGGPARPKEELVLDMWKQRRIYNCEDRLRCKGGTGVPAFTFSLTFRLLLMVSCIDPNKNQLQLLRRALT